VVGSVGVLERRVESGGEVGAEVDGVEDKIDVGAGMM
jgi:hypothetical protein